MILSLCSWKAERKALKKGCKIRLMNERRERSQTWDVGVIKEGSPKLWSLEVSLSSWRQPEDTRCLWMGLQKQRLFIIMSQGPTLCRFILWKLSNSKSIKLRGGKREREEGGESFGCYCLNIISSYLYSSSKFMKHICMLGRSKIL